MSSSGKKRRRLKEAKRWVNGIACITGEIPDKREINKRAKELAEAVKHENRLLYKLERRYKNVRHKI